MDAKNGGTFLYTFLRISPRKINILKNSKLSLRELNKLDDMNAKKMLLNLANILKPTIEMPKKTQEKIKMLRIFSYSNMLKSASKQVSFLIKKC